MRSPSAGRLANGKVIRQTDKHPLCVDFSGTIPVPLLHTVFSLVPHSQHCTRGRSDLPAALLAARSSSRVASVAAATASSIAKQ